MAETKADAFFGSRRINRKMTAKERMLKRAIAGRSALNSNQKSSALVMYASMGL